MTKWKKKRIVLLPYAKVGWACQPNTIKRKDRRNEKTKCKDYDGGGGGVPYPQN